jgi:hypothetical protein
MVMLDDPVTVLLAVAALVLLGIILLYRRMSSARARSSAPIKSQNDKFIERLLKDDARLAKAPAPRASDRTSIDKITEQTFRNMFFTTADRGEGLIEHYMTRHKCGRLEAMRRAIEEREREARD